MQKIFISFFILLSMTLPTLSQEHHIDLKTVGSIENMNNVISLHDSIFMAGQPDEAALKKLKALGFEIVINIRAKDEMTIDEDNIVKEAGLIYYNIPLMKEDKIIDAAVDEIHTALKDNKGKKILLHCSSGNRVAAWFGAHLGRDMDYDTEAAVTLAKQAGMTKDSMETILRDYLTTRPQ
ncbi:MAG: hypothetical protein K9G26_04325 [Emcibacter sp.]|nr:hypothetical protein [Emcibacter sp.]